MIGMQARAFCLAALVSTTLAPRSVHAQVGVEFTVLGGRSVASPLRWGVGGVGDPVDRPPPHACPAVAPRLG